MNIGKGIRVGGETINNIRYADDTALLAENIEDLQELLNRVNTECQNYGLSINKTKTKFMVISKMEVPDNQDLRLDGEALERVTKFKYLGCWINEELNPDMEVRSRIEQSRSAFIKLQSLLCNPHLDISTRKKFCKGYVWSVLLYGSENWVLTRNLINKIEAFEMWTYRRMMKISWTSHTSNDEVLQMVGEERNLFKTVKKRKMEYFGHIMRGPKYNLLRLILNGKMEGKKWLGRKKLSWLRNIRQWTGLTAEQLFHTALDRHQYQNLITMAVANA